MTMHTHRLLIVVERGPVVPGCGYTVISRSRSFFVALCYPFCSAFSALIPAETMHPTQSYNQSMLPLMPKWLMGRTGCAAVAANKTIDRTHTREQKQKLTQSPTGITDASPSQRRRRCSKDQRLPRTTEPFRDRVSLLAMPLFVRGS